MKPADVAGLNDAASEAPTVESRTRKFEPEEVQTGTLVPTNGCISRVPLVATSTPTEEASHVDRVLQRNTTDTVW